MIVKYTPFNLLRVPLHQCLFGQKAPSISCRCHRAGAMQLYYLRRRSHGIAAHGFVLGRREVSHDEPQESILGLLLFLIKPMTRRRMGVAQILFADGTT